MDAGVPRTSVQKLYLLDGAEKIRPGICSGVLVLVEFSPRGDFLITGGFWGPRIFTAAGALSVAWAFQPEKCPLQGCLFNHRGHRGHRG